jgi:MFS family permease
MTIPHILISKMQSNRTGGIVAYSSTTLAPLRHETYRTIWFASIASNFGGLIQAVGAAWMMTTITSSGDMVALVQTSIALPIMLFSLVSGALADSFDRRRVMLAAQCFMLAVSAFLSIGAYLGWLSPWLLLSDRLRHGAEQSLLASIGRGHGATR